MPQPQRNDGPQTWSNQSPSTSSSTEDTKNEAVEGLKERLTSGAREPAIFLGDAFFAGLLGGRFLKAAKPAARMSAGTGAGGGTREPVAGNPSKPATPSQPKPNEGGNGQKTSPTPGTGNGNGSTGNGSGAGNGPTEKSSSTDKPDAPRTGKGPGAG